MSDLGGLILVPHVAALVSRRDALSTVAYTSSGRRDCGKPLDADSRSLDEVYGRANLGPHAPGGKLTVGHVLLGFIRGEIEDRFLFGGAEIDLHIRTLP